MPKKLEETKEIKDKKNTTKTKSTKTSTIKKTTNKKETLKVSTKQSTKKGTKSTTKKTSKNSTTAKKSVTKKIIKPTPVEYYDLPYSYNQTVVKVLAQTPKTLFVYWEISEDDKEKFKEQYGENFFETTKPVLIIHNETLSYSFEVEINDFANSWYLHVNDSKADYKIELGRRYFDNSNNNISNNYVYVTSSNEIESPNDHILFDKSQNMVYFRNVKTNVETKKDVSSLSFIKNMGEIYNIYDLYKKIYKEENPFSSHLLNLNNINTITKENYNATKKRLCKFCITCPPSIYSSSRK